MLATIFDQELNFVEEIVLKEGDMAIMAYGAMVIKFLRIIQKL